MEKMQRNNRTQTRSFKPLVASLVLLLGGAIAQTQAHAGCLDFKASNKVSWQPQGDQFGAMKFIKVSETEDWSQGEWEPTVHRAPIVGLWEFKYISKGNAETLNIPDGAIIDGGITLWYADGNENTVSGVRDPSTGDVCLGVWKRTGDWTYELNHIGLSWDATKHVYVGPAFIKQHVTLGEDKQHYTGTFTIDQLNPDGKTPALPALIKGTITATRVQLATDKFEALP
jgi:hypothetical protein